MNNCIGKYGYMRLDFLKEHRSEQYTELRQQGELRTHLATVEHQAREYSERVVPEIARAWGVTEKMKQDDQMKWVGLMNSARAAVDEIIIAEIICV